MSGRSKCCALFVSVSVPTTAIFTAGRMALVTIHESSVTNHYSPITIHCC